jgi:hypothetical protein
MSKIPVGRLDDGKGVPVPFGLYPEFDFIGYVLKTINYIGF